MGALLLATGCKEAPQTSFPEVTTLATPTPEVKDADLGILENFFKSYLPEKNNPLLKYQLTPRNLISGDGRPLPYLNGQRVVFEKDTKYEIRFPGDEKNSDPDAFLRLTSYDQVVEKEELKLYFDLNGQLINAPQNLEKYIDYDEFVELTAEELSLAPAISEKAFKYPPPKDKWTPSSSLPVPVLGKKIAQVSRETPIAQAIFPFGDKLLIYQFFIDGKFQLNVAHDLG